MTKYGRDRKPSAHWPAVWEDGTELEFADTLQMFSSIKHLISIPFSVPQTIICFEQTGLRFVDFAFLEGVQRRIELLRTCTSQSMRSLTKICRSILERANRISLARAWLYPPPACSAHDN
jgi:hypothetical protein